MKLNARIVATVSADYDTLVEAGKLRRDLISELSVLSLRVPPLREYSEDVPDLLAYNAVVAATHGLGARPRGQRPSLRALRLRGLPAAQGRRPAQGLRIHLGGKERTLSA